MKRFIPLAVAVAAANSAAAQSELEHVLVSVPLHKKTAETALPVTVLSGDELRRVAASSIGDTLSNTPGLANASFGPGVGQPVIRGQQGARVTVLQNGTSSADASNLSADHAVSVEPLLADSIEVLRGPSTLLYGGGAIGGVVNVLDNRIPTSLPDEPSGGLEYRHDSASDMDNVVGRLEGGSGNFALHVDALYRDWSDLEIPGYAERVDHDEGEEHGEEEAGRKGVLENTGGRTRSLTLGGSYHFEDGFFGLAVSRLENTYGIPAGAHAHHGEEEYVDDNKGEEQDEGEEEGVTLDVEQVRYDAALHWHEPVAGLEVVRGFLTYTDYEHKEIEGSGEVGTTYANDSWEGRLELVHETMANFHGVFGLQIKSAEFSALGEEAFIPVTDSDETGLFLLEDWHRGDWTFEFGARYDHDKRDPDSAVARSTSFNAVSASVSALWNFAADWQIGAALSAAERAPTIEELYSNVEASNQSELVVHAATNAIEIGSVDLETETSNNLDVSIDWLGDEHYVSFTVFYNDFVDYIGLLATGEEVDEVMVYAYDQEDAEFYGIEIDSEFTLAGPGDGDLRLRLFGDLIRGELDNGDNVPRLPPRRVGARLSWTNDSWQFWGQVVDAADQDRAGANAEETDGYTRWDMGLDYRLPIAAGELVAFVNLNNISDEEIRLSTSFLRDVAPEGGRSIEAGLRYSF
ncbi:TonB-dependent receptor [Pseudohalioglobus lutimaris]|uniref:TonB-dependent receptor n=1 Tax=Pseudohalioglobus lutimaris TaxID=1737061 RepID=A0A2N5X3X7_9GAMM|nr:TonB-dependent receptor [Pseudohalioglobus lutimaris]PLW69206.1 TonB-dependent receptor [Pseudohalioglobus lutimaris]